MTPKKSYINSAHILYFKDKICSFENFKTKKTLNCKDKQRILVTK